MHGLTCSVPELHPQILVLGTQMVRPVHQLLVPDNLFLFLLPFSPFLSLHPFVPSLI